MKYKAILFDCDGVLIISEQLTAKASACALREFGIPCRESDFLPFVGTGELGYMGGVAALYGKSYAPEMTERTYEYYEMLISEKQKPDGLDEVLSYLKSKGYKMAVCSSANVQKVNANLRAIGRGKDFFDVIISGNDVTYNKPNPDIFLTAAARLEEKPEDCVVVEDAINGLLAAKAAKMDSIAVCTTFSREALMEQAEPTRIAESFLQLRTFL